MSGFEVFLFSPFLSSLPEKQNFCAVEMRKPERGTFFLV